MSRGPDVFFDLAHELPGQFFQVDPRPVLRRNDESKLAFRPDDVAGTASRIRSANRSEQRGDTREICLDDAIRCRQPGEGDMPVQRQAIPEGDAHEWQRPQAATLNRSETEDETSGRINSRPGRQVAVLN